MRICVAGKVRIEQIQKESLSRKKTRNCLLIGPRVSEADVLATIGSGTEVAEVIRDETDVGIARRPRKAAVVRREPIWSERRVLKTAVENSRISFDALRSPECKRDGAAGKGEKKALLQRRAL